LIVKGEANSCQGIRATVNIEKAVPSPRVVRSRNPTRYSDNLGQELQAGGPLCDLPAPLELMVGSALRYPRQRLGTESESC
jgi:hypothetical protein